MKRTVVFRILLLVAFAFEFTGCATFNKQLKALVSGKPAPKVASARGKRGAPAPQRRVASFSQRPNLPFKSRRKYRTMTKERFVQQAAVSDNAGSLWKMSGQSSFLFAQNTSRKDGDLLNVRLDGEAKEQLDSKVKTIRKLLSKLRKKKRHSVFNKLAAKKRRKKKGRKPASKDKEKKEEEEKKKEAAAAAAAAKDEEDSEPKGSVNAGVPVKQVPTRIVQKLSDGNYRVKGSQPFNIGKRQYRVIVTGIVRAEDFDDAGISSGKILDPRYDIVSARRRRF